MVLLSIIMVVSLAMGSVSLFAFGQEETTSNWASLNNGVYNEVAYTQAGNDYYLGTDADGNFFTQTVAAAKGYQFFQQKARYVNDFKTTFAITAVNSEDSFKEGATYIIGLGTIEMSVLNALELKYSEADSAFKLYTRAAGFNPDNGGAALQKDGSDILVAPGEQVTLEFKVSADQEYVDFHINGEYNFTSANYPCFAASPQHVYYNTDGAYSGYLFVDSDYVLNSGGGNAIDSRITFYELTEGTYSRVEEKVSWAGMAEGKVYDGATIGQAGNDFYLGTDKNGNFFTETVVAGAAYQAQRQQKYFVDGFKTTFAVSSLDPSISFNDNNSYLIGLGSAEQGMLNVLELKYSATDGVFKVYARAAGGNYDTTTEVLKDGSGNEITVSPGAKISLEFKANDDHTSLDYYINEDKVLTSANYPHFAGSAAHTYYAENGSYYGYLIIDSNYLLAAGTAVINSRITFYELTSGTAPVPPEKPSCDCCGSACENCICVAGEACDANCTCGNANCVVEPEGLDKTIDTTVALTTLAGLTPTYADSLLGDMSFSNPIGQGFNFGRDSENNIIFESYNGVPYYAMSSSKAYVDGFKMTFMVQNLANLAVGSQIQIGLSNAMNGTTMAAINLKWAGKYFEMKYSSAGIANMDGQELSTYEGIDHLWLGQYITFEFRANATAGLDIYVNDTFAFTTGYYPSFNGLADYTFPQDSNGYYGYFSIHNSALGDAGVNSRLTFKELTILPEQLEDYEFDAVENLIDSADSKTFSNGMENQISSYKGVKYKNMLGVDYWYGTDVDGNLYFQTEGNIPYTALSDQKTYIDGFEMSLMIQETAKDSLINGASFHIGLSQNVNGLMMSSIKFVWNDNLGVFNMYYIAAGFNGEGSRLDTYSENLHRLHLGEKVTIQYKVNASNQLEIWMNGIKTITTPNYPAYQGLADYTFPNDSYGHYGYFGIDVGCFPSQFSGSIGSRITFYELTCNGFASGEDVVYDADDSATYATGTTIGSIANDFVYRTLTTGTMKDKVLFESGAQGAFSFAYTEKAILNAFGIALNATHNGTKDTPAYAIKLSSGSNYITLRLEKTAENVATVYVVNAAGTESLGTVAFDWVNKNATQICNIGLFVNEDSVVLVVGSAVYTLGEEYVSLLNSFEKDGDDILATVEIINEEGISSIVISELITDGNAVQKKVARAIQTTLANVGVANGAEFNNPYSSVEVLFYDGSVETFEVTWDDSAVNTAFATIYTVTGTFDNITSAYYFSEEIKELLTFNVEVAYPEGFVTYGTVEYNATGSIWQTCGGGSNNFIYKANDDGTETFISDGYGPTIQFMPATTQYRDIDGYSITFTENRFGKGSGLFILMLLPEPKHPVEFGTKYFALHFNTVGEQFFVNFAGSNGAKEAFLKAPDGTIARQIDGAESQKMVRLAIVESDNVRYVKYYVTVNGAEYELVNGDGSEYMVHSYFENFINDRMYVSLWNEQGVVELTFKEDYTKYVTSYNKPADAIVNYGSEHGLPTTITLTLNNGDTVEGTVTWAGDYNKEVAGNYNLTGTISYSGNVALGNDKTIFDGVSNEFKVKVTVKEEVKKITSFTAPQDVTISVGEEYEIPTTFTVDVYSEYTQSTTQVEINVVWSGNVNALSEGTYTVTASPVGGYVFADGINASVNVIVVAAESNKGGCGSSIAVSSLFGAVAALGFVVVGLKKKR